MVGLRMTGLLPNSGNAASGSEDAHTSRGGTPSFYWVAYWAGWCEA